MIHRPTNGRPLNPDHCYESVADGGRWPSYHQCLRKWKVMDSKTGERWCATHDPTAKEAKREKEREAERLKREKVEQLRQRMSDAAEALGVSVDLQWRSSYGYVDVVCVSLTDFEALAERLRQAEVSA